MMAIDMLTDRCAPDSGRVCGVAGAVPKWFHDGSVPNCCVAPTSVCGASPVVMVAVAVPKDR